MALLQFLWEYFLDGENQNGVGAENLGHTFQATTSYAILCPIHMECNDGFLSAWNELFIRLNLIHKSFYFPPQNLLKMKTKTTSFQ